MPSFRICGIPDDISNEVRNTLRSPGYGHPVISEIATGTGPCRACLGLFVTGQDERLLFTYGPYSGTQTVAAPGPVFVHADACPRYDGTALPNALRDLPLLLEGRTDHGTVTRSLPATGKQVDGVLERLLADPGIDFVFVRHGEAGCHIARVDRE